LVLFGEHFALAQIIALFIMIPSSIFIFRLCREKRNLFPVFWAYLFLLISTIFGILRELFLWDTMRILEWTSILFSSIIFLHISYSTFRNLRGE
jgi:uncharacterized membrane protein